jgi:hypothetical protein
MKAFTFLALLSLLPVCQAEENPGKICLHIPEKGVETVKIEHSCKKGDIIQLNKLNIPNLCDFNSAIVPYEGHDEYMCVYLGQTREVREGTYFRQNPAP